MEALKRVIRESIREAWDSVMSEEQYSGPVTSLENYDEIINNYPGGNEFAGILQNDIENLDQYTLLEYIPRGENSEAWTFEFNGIHTPSIFEVTKNRQNGNTYWTATTGKAYNENGNQGQEDRYQKKIITAKDSVNNVRGYNNFIRSVNMSLSGKLDPSKI